MRKEIKQKWVQALKSGDYGKSKGRLRTKDTFDALGVLCEIHRKTTRKGDCKWSAEKPSGARHYMGEKWYLPKTVQKWAGLESNNPIIDGFSLTHRSDIGQTFNAIAVLINKYL